ncbi:hypothetical protein AeMF1_001503 [Aphanomyces euteiches]|nr:hypothetical protein AeMF1_001503 [Aphanomyces euteiches]
MTVLPAKTWSSRRGLAAGVSLRMKREKAFLSDRQKLTEESILSKILLGNEQWDLFHGIPKGYSLRTRVRIKLETSRTGYAWDILQTIVSLVACALCVVQSYMPDASYPQLDLVICGVFAADYILRFYCAENRYIFPFTFTAIIDVLAVAPTIYDRFIEPLAEIHGQKPTLAFVRFIRVLRVMKVIQMSRHSPTQLISAVQQQLISLGLLITSIVFVSACLFQLVENSYRDSIITADGRVVDESLTLGDCFYFILVTISTVGYGDVIPVTTFGKFVTCAMILMSLVMLPKEVNRLIELLSMQSPFRRTYNPHPANPHVLLLGYVSNATTLMDFINEFYHPDRIVGNGDGIATMNNIPCVIMAPMEPTEEVRALLLNPLLQNKVIYIKGSIFNEDDFRRVGGDMAQAAFLLTDKNSNDSTAEDANTVLRSLLLENANPLLQVFMQVIRPSYTEVLTHNHRHHVLCIDELKLNLLAKNCLCPGLSTLVCNLFRSSNIPDALPAAEWRREYMEGCTMEIYTTAAPFYLTDLPFTQAASILYDIFDGEVILVGVHQGDISSRSFAADASCYKSRPTFLNSIKALSASFFAEEVHAPWSRSHPPSAAGHNDDKTRTRRTFVNPGANFVLKSHHTLYVLCESRNVAQLVSSSAYYNHWVDRGNTIDKSEPPLPQINNVHLANTKLVATRASVCRSRKEVCIGAAVPLEDLDPFSSTATLRDHIIVVSDLVDVPIETFIKPLRLTHYTNGSQHFHPIVFVSTNEAAIDVAFASARHYDGVYLMHTSTESNEMYFRAGILEANCCVLLAEMSGQRVMDGESLDSRAIFRYLTVQKILEKHSQTMHVDFAVFVEMTASSTIKVLNTTLTKRIKHSVLSSNPKQGRGNLMQPRRAVPHVGVILESLVENHQIAWRRHLERKASKRAKSMPASALPFYAAGYGMSTDFFDSLLCQSFFTPELLQFAQELLCMDQNQETTSNNLNGDIVSSSISQIPLPASFVGQSFGDLYSHLLDAKSAIAIGLYRNSRSHASLPYVYTVPKRNTLLRADDFVFVLAQPHVQISFENANVVETRNSQATTPFDPIQTQMPPPDREIQNRQETTPSDRELELQMAWPSASPAAPPAPSFCAPTSQM